MKLIALISFLSLTVSFSHAKTRVQHHYYGKTFYTQYLQPLAARRKAPTNREFSKRLRNSLFTILSSRHQVIDGGFDLINNCQNRSQCYKHTTMEYSKARRVLYLQLHSRIDNRRKHQLYFEDVYCEHKVAFKMNGNQPVMPNHTQYNVEHTWPKSKFGGTGSYKFQVADLHHLYPSNSVLNSTRSNFRFGEVDTDLKSNSCPSKLGLSSANHKVFEPPKKHKGNVARALFYFSVRYQIQIPQHEEMTLRKWHREDPVDAEEKLRNNKIYKIQKNRNPFIDYPMLAQHIKDF